MPVDGHGRADGRPGADSGRTARNAPDGAQGDRRSVPGGGSADGWRSRRGRLEDGVECLLRAHGTVPVGRRQVREPALTVYDGDGRMGPAGEVARPVADVRPAAAFIVSEVAHVVPAVLDLPVVPDLGRGWWILQTPVAPGYAESRRAHHDMPSTTPTSCRRWKITMIMIHHAGIFAGPKARGVCPTSISHALGLGRMKRHSMLTVLWK